MLLTPTAAVKDVRGEMRLGGGLGEEPVIGDHCTSGNNEEFSFVSSSVSSSMTLKCYNVNEIQSYGVELICM